MFLIIGLGNPEKDYGNTRHNMGFNVINKIAEKYNIEVNKNKFKALFGSGSINDEKVILLKPQTFMNLSGESVREAIDFYKVELDQVLIIYDDIDLAPGKIRIKKNGGPGTHNGMRSIVQHLGTENFARLRVGIGKPEDDTDLVEYVIGYMSKEDKELLEKGVNLAVEAVDTIMTENIDNAMNKYN